MTSKPFYIFSLIASLTVRPGVSGRRALSWLLAATGLVSVTLLLVALAAAGRSTQAFQDVNLSGSLRYRSLWMYGATQVKMRSAAPGKGQEDGGWQGQAAAMQDIRLRLARRYPAAVRATDPAWNTFLGSLQRTGQVDWPTANAMRAASNTQTAQIQKEASARNAWASLLLRLGVAGLLAALAASGLLLLGLRTAEAERQSAEKQLQRERDFQGAMLESLQSGIVACDADGTLALFNQAAREFHGLSAEPLSAQQWDERFALFQSDGVTPLETQEIPLLRALHGEVVRDVEVVIAPQNRPARTVLISGQAICSADGTKLGAVVALHDVTARRRVERELSRLASIVQSSEEAILAVTLDGTLVSWNAGAERLYGYAESEIVGQHASVLVPPGESSIVEAAIPQLMRGESLAPAEVVRQHRSGAVLNLALTFSPIHDPAGQVVGVSCIARDVTARRRAEDALRESEARLRYLSNAAFEGIAVSQNGRILDANSAFLSLYGYNREEAVGMAGTAFAAPESQALVAQKVAAGEESAYEALCLRRDGSTFPAEVRGRRVLWNGLPARVTAVRDITERKVLEDALRESQRFASSVAENSAGLIFVLDLETRSNVYANRNLGDFLGYEPEAMPLPGTDLLTAVVHPDDIPRMLMHLADFAARKDGEIVEFEYRLKHTSGEWRWIWSREVVFKRRADGTPWQILGNAQDVTPRRAVEEALRRSEEALRAMLGSAPVILYAADADGVITLSEGTGLTALGLAPGEAVGRSVFEFGGGDAAVIAANRRALAGEAVSYDARFGALCLHMELKPQRDESGAVVGMIGVSFDVTERAQSEERFRVLFEQSSDAHLLFDDAGIIDCNAAALTVMRCTDKARLLGVHPARLSPERQPDGQLSEEKGAEMCRLARQNGSHRFEWLRLTLDGTEIPVDVTLTEVTLRDKPVLLSVWHDLTERKRAEQQIKDYTVILEFQKSQLEQTNRELESLATTDGLTNLKNRRTFSAKLADEHARAMRYHPPLSLLLLDVDHFKEFNDTFGHLAGDAVLRSVASALEHTARDTDLTARYGGEEFALILPQTDEAGAMVIAERIRTALDGRSWDLRPITVSIGVCTLSLATPTPESMVACADRALYRSKETGRNRATHGNFAAPPVGSPALTAGEPRPETPRPETPRPDPLLKQGEEAR